MELTSSSLVYSLVVLAAAALVATVWLWPRLATQRPLPVLGRLGLLTIGQVAVIGVLALSFNDTYGFYTSWQDLLNSGGAPLALTAVSSSKAGSDSAKLVQPSTEGLDAARNALPKGKPEEVGRIDSVKINGPESGLSDQLFVYLPPEYFSPRYTRERFPVLFALAGYPGSALHLIQELKLPQTVSDMERNGRMAPTIVVMARPTVAPPRNTECVDVPNGPKTETWFAKDVPNALRSAYRVSRTPSTWGILGYSTGGSCALRLAMRNASVYPNAAGLHPEYQVPGDRNAEDYLFHGGDPNLGEQSDLNWRLRNLPAPKVSLLVVSTRAEDDYHQTNDFLANAQPIAAAHPEFKVDSLFLNDGGHNFDTWRRELPAALEWMSDHLAIPTDRDPRQP